MPDFVSLNVVGVQYICNCLPSSLWYSISLPSPSQQSEGAHSVVCAVHSVYNVHLENSTVTLSESIPISLDEPDYIASSFHSSLRSVSVAKQVFEMTTFLLKCLWNVMFLSLSSSLQCKPPFWNNWIIVKEHWYWWTFYEKAHKFSVLQHHYWCGYNPLHYSYLFDLTPPKQETSKIS